MLTNLAKSLRNVYQSWNVPMRVAHYNTWTERSKRSKAGSEAYDHSNTVNDYYDLCTELMQFGWNDSLHFAPLRHGETLEECIVQHQLLMIEKLQLSEDMKVIDVGCGVGGPMRKVASETGVSVLCINNNELQLEKSKQKNVEAGLDHLAEYMKCSFMDMSEIEADSFDAGYAIESTCHAPSKLGAFKEIFRVLKPGARLWGQEMCMTDAFDPSDPTHCHIKDELMRGIALNEIATFSEVNADLEAAGFEILEASDRGALGENSVPWYQPMADLNGSLQNMFRRTPLGRKAMVGGLKLAEVMRIVPSGSTAVVQLMDRTADAYVAGGETGIFTTLYNFVAQKPE